MFQKKDKKELDQMDLKTLDEHRKTVRIRQAELLTKKKTAELTKEEQEELEEVAVYAVTLDKQYDANKKAEAVEAADKELAAAKKDKVALLLISRGHKFDPNTGKPLSPTYKQTFTASEYRLFMAHYQSLGYKIEKELYNPFKK